MTRPDYCPIAQEPCQAMCVLTGVRCQLQPIKPASTEDLKVYQSIADNYKKGTTMNQHDQMREALRRYDEFECKNCDQQLNKAERTIEIFRQALSHVNETPKNEHDSNDVLKRAPLVRLMDQEIAEEYCKADAYLMMTDHYEFGLVANAIQNAMQEKNK